MLRRLVMPPSRSWSKTRTLAGALAVFVGASITPARALAFEKQWHLGGGAGIVAPSSEYDVGGSVALHAAYGLSDMFDARFDLRSSLHDLSDGDDGRTTLWLGSLGVAYKLDVIEWVPYLGIRAGYYRFGTQPAGDYQRHGGMLGTVLGLDYAFSRSAGVGVELEYDTLLPSGGAFGALLHAEYRWGF